MNEKAKQMLIMFAGAVIISGVITLQVIRSRPAAPIVNTDAEAAQETAAAPPPPTLAPAPAPAETPVTTGLEPAPAIIGEATPTIETVQLPAGEWGRNPFLTLSEIAALAPQPLIPVIINVPEPILAPLPQLAAALPEIHGFRNSRRGRGCVGRRGLSCCPAWGPARRRNRQPNQRTRGRARKRRRNPAGEDQQARYPRTQMTPRE